MDAHQLSSNVGRTAAQASYDAGIFSTSKKAVARGVAPNRMEKEMATLPGTDTLPELSVWEPEEYVGGQEVKEWARDKPVAEVTSPDLDAAIRGRLGAAIEGHFDRGARRSVGRRETRARPAFQARREPPDASAEGLMGGVPVSGSSRIGPG